MLKKLVLFLSLSATVNANSIKNWGVEPNCAGDEFDGVCVRAHNCLSTNPYISGLKYPKPCMTVEGHPGVCCTDCKLVFNASNAILDLSAETGLLWKTGEIAWDKCIEYRQKYKYFHCGLYNNMIRYATDEQCHGYSTPTHRTQAFSTAAVGGFDARRGEYPHMALLGYADTQNPSEWQCSGSLISERHILTAAHCIISANLGPVSEVALGIHKRSDPAELWHKYKIKRVIPHPLYKSPSKYHDIAILETEIPVTFINETVLPACLPAHDNRIQYDAKPGFSITATGWGNLGYLREASDTLQKVYLTKFSEEECEELYPEHRLQSSGLNHSTQMCYGHKTDIRDTCKGDSGGPLQTDTHHPTCISTLIGITSYGRECGFQGQAGVYTRISTYLPWIESIVWP